MMKSPHGFNIVATICPGMGGRKQYIAIAMFEVANSWRFSPENETVRDWLATQRANHLRVI
jgi:hypothetical protein